MTTAGLKISIKLNDTPLEQVTLYKYLGIELNIVLNWDSQWQRVQKLISSTPYLIKQLKHFGFKEEILITVYRSLAISHFTYSAPILTSTSVKIKEEFKQYQNRILRIIGISQESAFHKYNLCSTEDTIDRKCLNLL